MWAFVSMFVMLFVVACTDDTNGTDQEKNNEVEVNQQEEQNIQQTNGNNNDNNDSASEPTADGDKTVIQIAYPWGEDSFNGRFKGVETVLDDIVVEHVAIDNTVESWEELFLNDIYPDIFVNSNVYGLQELKITQGLDDLIEKTGFNLDIFEPSLIEAIRIYDENNELIGIPDGTSKVALGYNKEIFDLFGVDYPDPEKPMTWPELLDLARQMTEIRDGQQYIGFSDANIYMLHQYAPHATDPETGEVLINENPAYRKYVEFIHELYNIPGLTDVEQVSSFQDKISAMAIVVNDSLTYQVGNDPEPVDLAPVPVWPDQPNIGPFTGTTPMVVTNYSEKQEEALKVLETMFEPELIQESVRNAAVVPPLADMELMSQYAQDREPYPGKNLAAFHVLEMAVPEKHSRWDKYVNMERSKELVREGEDVNSVLRIIQEEAEAAIAEAKAAEGS